MRKLSHHAPLALAGVVLAALLTGCAGGPEIRADYDKAADFGKYRPYGFVAQAGADTGDVRSLATEMLQNAASREMESRGYAKAEAVLKEAADKLLANTVIENYRVEIV